MSSEFGPMRMLFPCVLCNNMFDNLESCTYHIMLMHASAPFPCKQALNLRLNSDVNSFIPPGLQFMFRSKTINADNDTIIGTQLTSQVNQFAAINNYQLFANAIQGETHANHFPIVNIGDQQLSFIHESTLLQGNMLEMENVQSTLGTNYVPDLISYSQFGEGVNSKQVYSSAEIDIGNTLNDNDNIGVVFDIGEYSTNPESQSFPQQCFVSAYDVQNSNVLKINDSINDQCMLAKSNSHLPECSIINECATELHIDSISRNDSVRGLNFASGSPPEESSFIRGINVSLSSKSTLKNELKLESKCGSITSKVYRCGQCSYVSSRSDHIQRHMSVHTNEKPYKCKLCPYITAHNGNLTSHLRTHNGEKPYRCHLCSFASAYKSHLNCHKRIHTGEKPYKCNYCTYASAYSGSLRIHVSTHNGENLHKCKECLYATYAISNLKVHMLRHTIKHKFQCDICSYSCRNFHHLNVHKRKNHKC